MPEAARAGREAERRFEAALASTLAGDLGSTAQAEAEELFLRLAAVWSNDDFLGLGRAWAVETGPFRRILAEREII